MPEGVGHLLGNPQPRLGAGHRQSRSSDCRSGGSPGPREQQVHGVGDGVDAPGGLPGESSHRPTQGRSGEGSENRAGEHSTHDISEPPVGFGLHGAPGDTPADTSGHSGEGPEPRRVAQQPDLLGDDLLACPQSNEGVNDIAFGGGVLEGPEYGGGYLPRPFDGGTQDGPNLGMGGGCDQGLDQVGSHRTGARENGGYPLGGNLGLHRRSPLGDQALPVGSFQDPNQVVDVCGGLVTVAQQLLGLASGDPPLVQQSLRHLLASSLGHLVGVLGQLAQLVPIGHRLREGQGLVLGHDVVQQPRVDHLIERLAGVEGGLLPTGHRCLLQALPGGGHRPAGQDFMGSFPHRSLLEQLGTKPDHHLVGLGSHYPASGMTHGVEAHIAYRLVQDQQPIVGHDMAFGYKLVGQPLDQASGGDILYPQFVGHIMQPLPPATRPHLIEGTGDSGQVGLGSQEHRRHRGCHPLGESSQSRSHHLGGLRNLGIEIEYPGSVFAGPGELGHIPGRGPPISGRSRYRDIVGAVKPRAVEIPKALPPGPQFP